MLHFALNVAGAKETVTVSSATEEVPTDTATPTTVVNRLDVARTPPVETLNRFSVPDLTANSATCTPVPDCQFIQAGTNGIPKATCSIV